MLRGETTGIKEYLIRTYGETWVKPVLKQLLAMLKTYETDQVVLSIAASRSRTLQKLSEKLGVQIDLNFLHQLLEQDLKTVVNVGLGATDPILKINNFRLILDSLTATITTAPPGFYNVEELTKEMFGRAGYDDGSRFVNLEEGQDPEKMQLTQMVQELQAKLESKMDELQTKLMIQQMKDESEIKRLLLDIQGEKQLAYIDRETDIILEKVKGRYAQRQEKQIER